MARKPIPRPGETAPILIVDDEELIRDTLAEYLTQQGFEVTACGSAERALEEAARRPYAEWYRNEVVRLEDLPARPTLACPTQSLRTRQLAFGYTQDDMKVILAPLARNAEEAVGSMGNDLPLAVLSGKHQSVGSGALAKCVSMNTVPRQIDGPPNEPRCPLHAA